MTPAGAPGRIGPGRLVLVVGPSGAGKDTLIRSAREALAGDPGFVFPRRVVTRPPSEAEDNEPADDASFARRAAAGGFALAWAAHGLSYGVPTSIDDALRRGGCVVCNVSRTVVESARSRYGRVLVIEVTAPPTLLAQRLAARSRPEDGTASRRIERSREIPAVAADVVIVNGGRLDEASRAFREALEIADPTRPPAGRAGRPAARGAGQPGSG